MAGLVVNSRTGNILAGFVLERLPNNDKIDMNMMKRVFLDETSDYNTNGIQENLKRYFDNMRDDQRHRAHMRGSLAYIAGFPTMEGRMSAFHDYLEMSEKSIVNEDSFQNGWDMVQWLILLVSELVALSYADGNSDGMFEYLRMSTEYLMNNSGIDDWIVAHNGWDGMPGRGVPMEEGELPPEVQAQQLMFSIELSSQSETGPSPAARGTGPGGFSSGGSAPAGSAPARSAPGGSAPRASAPGTSGAETSAAGTSAARGGSTAGGQRGQPGSPTSQALRQQLRQALRQEAVPENTPVVESDELADILHTMDLVVELGHDQRVPRSAPIPTGTGPRTRSSPSSSDSSSSPDRPLTVRPTPVGSLVAMPRTPDVFPTGFYTTPPSTARHASPRAPLRPRRQRATSPMVASPRDLRRGNRVDDFLRSPRRRRNSGSSEEGGQNLVRRVLAYTSESSGEEQEVVRARPMPRLHMNIEDEPEPYESEHQRIITQINRSQDWYRGSTPKKLYHPLPNPDLNAPEYAPPYFRVPLYPSPPPYAQLADEE